MSTKGKISELYSLPDLEQQHKVAMSLVNDFVDKVSSVKSIKVNLEGAEKTKDVVKGVTELGLAVKEYSKIQDGVATSQAKINALQSEHAKVLQENKIAIQNRNKELKDQVLLEQAAAGSIDEKKVKLAQLQRAYDSLSATERNSVQGTALLKSIQDLDGELKTLEGSTGRFQRNVGNYSGAVKILETELGNVRKKLEEYNATGKGSADVIAELTKQEGLLAKLTENQVNGFASATAEVRNNEHALQALAAAGQENTAFYQSLLSETAELKNHVHNLQEEIKNLSSNTKTLDGLIAAAQGLAGAFGVAQGAAALFGDDNEDLQKTFVKLQAVMTILNSLQAIQNTLQQENAAILLLQSIRAKAAAIAQAIFTAAVGASTGAMRVFRVALLSSGIGIILLLLPLAAKAMDFFTTSTKLNAEEQKSLNDVMKEGNSLLKERISLINAATEEENQALQRQMKLLEATGALTTDIFDIKQKIAENSKQEAQTTIENLGITENKLISMETQLSLLNDKLEAARQIKIHAIEDKDERAIKAATQNIEILTGKYDLLKQTYDQGRAAIKQLNDAQTDMQENAINRANFLFQLERKRLQASLDILKLEKDGEIEALDEISSAEELSLSDRIKARQASAVKEQQIIQATRAFELGEKNLLDKEIDAINKKADKALVDSNQKLSTDLIAMYGQVKAKAREAFEADVALAADLPTRQQAFEKMIKTEEDLFAVRSATATEARDLFIKSLQVEENAQLKKAKTDEQRQQIEQEFTHKRVAREIEADREILLSAITLAQAKLKLVSDPKDRAELEAGIADSKRKLEELGKTDIDLKTEKAHEKLDRLKSQIQTIGGTIMKAFNAIGDIVSGSIDKQKNAIQDKIDLLDQQKEKDIEAANQSIANEQDKAAKIAVINARAQSQKEALQRRQRQLDQEKAKFDKAKSIAQIILDTASAVVEALPNIPLSIIIGAIGAAELAAAIAAPIPKFKKGKGEGNSYEGPAIVGDGGRSELILRDSGDVEITPAKDTLTYVGKKDIILPDAKAVLRAAQYGMLNNLRTAPDEMLARGNTRAVERKLDKLTEVVKNKREVHIKGSAAGMQMLHRHAQRQIQYINEQVHFKS